jgi:hypothetical protein
MMDLTIDFLDALPSPDLPMSEIAAGPLLNGNRVEEYQSLAPDPLVLLEKPMLGRFSFWAER